jgi:hypothetical protein
MTDFTCPEEIQDVAWLGDLVAAAGFLKGSSSDGGAAAPSVRLGKLEHWPLAEAPEQPAGGSWLPPPGGAGTGAAGNGGGYWLLRLGCSLQAPGKGRLLTEAQLSLVLRPSADGTAGPAPYAYALHPDREEVEDRRVLNFVLAALAGAAGAGSLGQAVGRRAGYEFRKVFPVIEGHGAGTATPYWIFRHHLTRPLAGTQFVYAVVAAAPKAAFWAALDLTATVQDTGLASWIRFAPPEKARDSLGFLIGNQGG